MEESQRTTKHPVSDPQVAQVSSILNTKVYVSIRLYNWRPQMLNLSVRVGRRHAGIQSFGIFSTHLKVATYSYCGCLAALIMPHLLSVKEHLRATADTFIPTIFTKIARRRRDIWEVTIVLHDLLVHTSRYQKLIIRIKPIPLRYHVVLRVQRVPNMKR